MIEVLRPPIPLRGGPLDRSVFLAGSIEMGTAWDWQRRVIDALKDISGVVLNPRRDDWDSSWTRTPDDPRFAEQIAWELEALERAETIVMHFLPETKSAVTLLELGLVARSGRLIVCCPEGYWRKGNVDMVCRRYGVRTACDLEELIVVSRETLLAPKRPC